MSDYISKKALLEKLKYMGDYNIDMDYVTAEDIMSVSSADVREVVFCKNCRFFRQGTMNFPNYCRWHGGFTPEEDWFCADGERIENE